jgi:hypothetical protein
MSQQKLIVTKYEFLCKSIADRLISVNTNLTDRVIPNPYLFEATV